MVGDRRGRDERVERLEDCTAEPIASDAPRSNHEATLLTLELLFTSMAKSDTLIAARR